MLCIFLQSQYRVHHPLFATPALGILVDQSPSFFPCTSGLITDPISGNPLVSLPRQVSIPRQDLPWNHAQIEVDPF